MSKVLGVLRLSRDTEESTSVARQREAVQAWADANGHTVIGWAEDVDVSGSVAPWDRDDLGRWMPRELGGQADHVEWDGLAAWRLDRVSRRVLHLATLIDWCKRNGKTITSSSEGFDITTGNGAIFVTLLAALAEGELEAMRERARSSFRKLVESGRWRGGFVPYGYRPAKASQGWELEIDPETSTTLKEIVRRICEPGGSVNSVVRWLNEEEIPSPLDAQRIRNGRLSLPEGLSPDGNPPKKRSEWRTGNLFKMLRSPTLLGQATITEKDADGKEVAVVVRDTETGLPLQRADPILTEAEYRDLMVALEKNSNPRGAVRYDRSPLLRVLYCECGEPLYRAHGRRLRYRCGLHSKNGTKCPLDVPSVYADELESAVVDGFLGIVGHLEVVRRVFVPGEDHTAEVARVEQAMAELDEARFTHGLYRGDRGVAEWVGMRSKLEARREALEALPSVPDSWSYEPTGVTYRERFTALTDDVARGDELRAAGVKAILRKGFRGDPILSDNPDEGRLVIELPADLGDRLATMGIERESGSPEGFRPGINPSTVL